MKLLELNVLFAALALTTTFAVAGESPVKAESRWLLDASKLNQAEVYDFHGQQLGHLDQVLIDPVRGHVRYGVVEVDEKWNFPDRKVAVPWGAFVVKQGEDKQTKLSLDATKERMEKAPKFQMGDASRLYDKEASEPFYGYWGIDWMEEAKPEKPVR